LCTKDKISRFARNDILLFLHFTQNDRGKTLITASSGTTNYFNVLSNLIFLHKTLNRERGIDLFRLFDIADPDSHFAHPEKFQ